MVVPQDFSSGDVEENMSKGAFVMRIAPSGVDLVPEALENNTLIIGWAMAEGLLDRELGWEEFRDIIRRTYYADHSDLRKAGQACGQMWRFIRDMKCGDLVVVPHGPQFYVGEVVGDALYDAGKVFADSAYRRPVSWLNNGEAIPRSAAKSALVSRMKNYGTCTNAGDLLEEIAECVNVATRGDIEPTSFERDLEGRLVQHTLDELRNGRMDSYGFERLVEKVLSGRGAVDTKIVPRSKDRGIDIVATFRVASTIRLVVGVQAKHYRPDPPVDVDVVEQLIHGVEEGGEDVTHGMVITSGRFTTEAMNRAEVYGERGIPIELIDGEQFAKLIVEHGLEVVRPTAVG